MKPIVDMISLVFIILVTATSAADYTARPGAEDFFVTSSRPVFGWLSSMTAGTVAALRIGITDTNTGRVVYPSASLATINAQLFGARPSARTFFAENIGFNFDAAGSFVQDVTLSSLTIRDLTNATRGCAMGDISLAALGAVPAASIRTFKMFFVPDGLATGACTGFAGLGVLGCVDNCYTWLFNSNLFTWIHELGHNFGLAHAGVDDNNDGVVDRNTVTGQLATYADASDPMGSSATRLHALHLARLATASMDRNPQVLSISNNDTTIQLRSASKPGIPMLLRISVPNADDTWWVSYRTAAPDTYDANLPNGWRDRVYIHRQRAAGQSTLLVVRLELGAVFTDTAHGIQIGHVNGQNVRVQTCTTPVKPTVTLVGSNLVRVTNPNTRCGLPSIYVARVITATRTCVNVTVRLTPDRFPREMSFIIVTGSVVILSGKVGNFSTTACGVQGDNITAVFMDTEGDGYCCKFGLGGYTLFINGAAVASGGNFAARQHNVTVGLAPYVQTPALAPGASTVLAFPTNTRTVLMYDERTPDLVVNVSFASVSPSRSFSRSTSRSSSRSCTITQTQVCR